MTSGRKRTVAATVRQMTIVDLVGVVADVDQSAVRFRGSLVAEERSRLVSILLLIVCEVLKASNEAL